MKGVIFMATYCITWGESGISTFLLADNESEAIIRFISLMRKEWGINFEPNIKRVNIIK